MEKKNTRTTLNGYYIHDCRKMAKYAFEDFLICVKLNEKTRCYDIFVRQNMLVDGKHIVLSSDELEKFRRFYPKTFNVILLSDSMASLLND